MLWGDDKPGLSPMKMMDMAAVNREPISSAMATLPCCTIVSGDSFRFRDFSLGISDWRRGMACWLIAMAESPSANMIATSEGVCRFWVNFVFEVRFKRLPRSGLWMYSCRSLALLCRVKIGSWKECSWVNRESMSKVE